MSPQASPPKCAICGKPQAEAHRPFCSKRCRQIDLGKWLGEGYAIPAVEGEDDGDSGQGEE
jgi:endogenous inhibitor of DNA gyrase (YacG/DUF329 family)